MDRFKSTPVSRSIKISIEYITPHEIFETRIVESRLPFGDNFDDAVRSVLSEHSIRIADVVSITTVSYEHFYNSQYHGKSYEVVGED